MTEHRDAPAVVVVDRAEKSHRRGTETVIAVRAATFEVQPATMTAIVGPSGSGKTTLLNLITGSDEPDGGEIRGIPPRGDWNLLAIVPQALGLVEELTIAENVGLPARFGATTAMSEQQAMDRLGLGGLADRLPAETSLGEQQRAAVARAVLTGPVLVAADEPTSHQDEANVMRVVDVLAECAASGSAVVVATHDQRVIDRCDVVLGLSDGVLWALR